MDIIQQRPDSHALLQIVMHETMFYNIPVEDLPIIAGPCPGKIYSSPTIQNSLPIYNTTFGIPITTNQFYTGWYGFSRNDILSLPHPNLLTNQQCGICSNCLTTQTYCINPPHVDYSYETWFYYLTELNDNNLSNTPTPNSSPIDTSSYCSTTPGTPDSDSIWLFH